MANKLRGSVDKISMPLQKFLKLESSSGIILFSMAVFAMIFANSSSLSDSYNSLLNFPITFSFGSLVVNKNLLLFVNDGLMAIFFFLVGLEIKREILVGELASPRKAAFSFFAAIGGMIFPALIYLGLNLNQDSASGWGIPMATDIAFALGVVTLLGKRVPTTIKVFLLALAIVDDLGAILIIALFYSGEISGQYLGVASIILILLYLLNHMGFRNMAIGIILGVITWFCFLKSGVHATIAGVLLAFLTPATRFGSSDRPKPGDHLLIDDYIHGLHPWVSYLIMPIFAFFNAGVNLGGVEMSTAIISPVGLGIILGLVIGKPLGIFLMTFIATKMKWADLPQNSTWPQIIAVGFIAGIGFTMSLFVSSLAFKGQSVEVYSKLGILVGSLISMSIGYIMLRIYTKK